MKTLYPNFSTCASLPWQRPLENSYAIQNIKSYPLRIASVCLWTSNGHADIIISWIDSLNPLNSVTTKHLSKISNIIRIGNWIKPKFFVCLQANISKSIITSSSKVLQETGKLTWPAPLGSRPAASFIK